MAFISDKWRDSSVFTKASTFAMAIDALLLLICSIMFFALSGVAGDGAVGYGVLFLAAALYNALLAFGLLKVNRIARIVTIYGGLCIIFPFILTAILFIVSLIKFPLLKTLLGLVTGLIKGTVPLVMSFVPGDAKALAAFLVIVFFGPFVLNVIAMLILFIWGGDFKGSGKKKSKIVAYLLWLVFGGISAHKFYLEKDRIGILYFLTCQILWFGWFINLFTLGKQVDAYNAKLTAEPQPLT